MITYNTSFNVASQHWHTDSNDALVSVTTLAIVFFKFQ